MPVACCLKDIFPIGLQEKLETRTEELSGGQRRKLSVAIAFLGSPLVVFLDEVMMSVTCMHGISILPFFYPQCPSELVFSISV